MTKSLETFSSLVCLGRDGGGGGGEEDNITGSGYGTGEDMV